MKSVELFSHLPQFDKEPLQRSFESLIMSGLPPEVVKLGRSYATNTITGANARCVAMLKTFKLVIASYATPPEKTLSRDLTSYLNVVIQFLADCRPLSVSMGNAIRCLKTRIGSIDPSTAELDAKQALLETIDRFVQDKIVDASATIADVACRRIRDGDVILTYAFSHAVFQTFKAAHARGIRFRVIAVDCRPHLEGRRLMSRLIALGVDCTYAHITALSYVMHQITTVLLGAASALANGTVISRVGSAAVALMAKEFGVPVIVCCETYKFHERVQLDAITSNELGDPDRVGWEGWGGLDNLRLLNLMYDAITAKYVTMIVTEIGLVPTSSVPVILREYGMV